MDEMKTLTINGKTYEVTDPDAPVKDVVSQGRSAKYTFTSPGWKRVMNIIRTSGGVVNFGISNANPLYMSQSAGICFGGFAEYKEDNSGLGQPMLYQLYDNVFGSDYGTGHPVRITAVRIGYPDPAQEPYDNGTSGDARVNPINCYLDVKVEYDEAVLESGTISFNMNYAGFADSHNCVPITVETNATDTGMYGESLLFHELYLRDGAMLYVPYGMAELPGFVKAGDGTTSPKISGLTTGAYGFKTDSTGTLLCTAMATDKEIDMKVSKFKPIVPSNLEYAVKSVGDRIYAGNEKLDILWKLNEGILYDFVTDTAAGYAKTVPAGCKYASIESIGGHTEVVDSESVSADVQSVKEQGFNWWDETWEIGALNVENGNTVSDTGCFRSKDFIPVLPSTNYYFCVKTETTGQTIRVVYYDKNKAYINAPGSDTNAIKQTPENCYFVKFYSRVSPTVYNGGICINVSNTEQNGTYKPYHAKTYTIPEAVRALTGYGWGSAAAYNSIERTDNGWQYVQRVDLPITDTGYTVLDEPILTDITDLMAAFPTNFAVEANGTIIFENAARLSVPNTVKYLRSLKEVSA